MPKPLRIFISSPGDVSAERRRAALVVESLKKEFARFFDISAYLWEHEAMLATGHFQDVIAPPSQSDIVVLILWSRLGTPLPVTSGGREYRGIDGRAPVTGTEWEYEDALAANKAKGAPDLLVYRSNREPQISLRDPQKKQLAEGQWSALETFWSRYFQAGGVFLSAYHGFDDLEDFGDMLEAHLRQLIRARIEKGRIEAGQDTKATWLQSPFRGLSSFEFEHAPIFFGRGAAQLKAVEQIVRNANEGKAFLLVLGASGSGKSSLVRAGLLPNLFARGVADGVGLWRRVVMKPGDADGNLFMGLTKALTENRVKEGLGIPEILGPGVTPEQLEKALRRSIDDPDFVFTPALARIAEDARKAGTIMAHEKVKLALVLDQLEEIFTDSSISTEERNSFIRLVSMLAKSGLVWIVATMRSDFWHKAAAAPELVALAEGLGRMDLLPPTQAELAEMIRRPAAVAGLNFEDHPESKIGLDAVIAEEAARDPGSLPLVSFVLDALYKADIEKARGSSLTYDTYQALGGIKGAIATRADEILAGLPDDVQAALPVVLRALVTVDSDRDQNATARTAPLSTFPGGSAKRSLVDAFLHPAARLLIADGDGGEARVRVAHEALINHWTRAREQINRDRRDLETRTRLEEDELLWRAAASEDKSARLLDGLSLEEGKDLVGKWDDELPGSLKEFIAESEKASATKRNRRFRILTAVAAVMAVLAVGAGVLGLFARQQSQIAEEESARAKTAEAQAETLLHETQRGSAELVARQSYLASKSGYSEQALALAVESVRIAQQAGGELPAASIAALQHAASNDTIVTVLTSADNNLRDVEFNATSTRIMTGNDNRQLTVWDTMTGAEVTSFGNDKFGFIAGFADKEDKYLAALYDDKTLEIYQTSDYQRLGEAFTFPAMPSAGDIDESGREIVVGDENGAVHFIAADSHTIYPSQAGHDRAVIAIGIAGNASIAVTGDSAGKAVIWDLSTHTQRTVIYHGSAESASSIEEIVVSPDGQEIALLGGGWIDLYDATGAPLQTISLNGIYIKKAVFSNDNQSLIYTSGRDIVQVSRSDRSIIKTFKGHTFEVRQLKKSRDGKRILTASGDNTLRLWDVDTGATLRVFRSPKGAIEGQGLSPDGNFVAAALEDGNVTVWSVDGLTPESARVVHESDFTSLSWSRDGQYVLSASQDGKAVMSDVSTGHPEFSIPEANDQYGSPSVNAATFTPDGMRIVTTDSEGRVRLWRTQTGDPVSMIGKMEDGGLEYGSALQVTPDGKYVLVAYNAGIAVFDLQATDAKPLRSFVAANVRFFNVAVSPDGKLVAGGAPDGTVYVWDFEKGRLLVQRREDHSSINSVGFSPDSQFVMTTSSDRTIRTFNASTGTPVLLMNGHDDFAMWSSYSADGQRIVSASFDGTVKIWDASTGAELMTFTGPGEPFRFVEFSPDAKRIAAGSDDDRLYIWQLPEKGFANTPTTGPVTLGQLKADDAKMLKEMLSWAPMTVSKPLSASDRRDNFLQPDAEVRVYDSVMHACDRLAAYISDPQAVSRGVREKDMTAPEAETACRDALASSPNEPRLHMQLGRALLAQGKEDDGRKELQIAVDANYPGGVYYLGFYLTALKDKPSADELRLGYDLVRKASSMGVPDASDLLAGAMLDGIKSEDGQEIIAKDEPGAIKIHEMAAEQGSTFSSTTMGRFCLYGERGQAKDPVKALYYYGIAARQAEISGLADGTEAHLAASMFARRASLARQLIREGKSAEVATVAERVANWKPASPPQQAAAQ